MFCSSNQAAGFYAAKGLDVSGSSSITLRNTSVRSNSITEPLALGVGSDLFVIGSVFFAADSASDVSMSGYSDRDVMSTVVTALTNSPHIAMALSCMNGTVLRIAPTSLSNTLFMSVPPSNASLFNSKCFPASLDLPVYETYVAASGVLASCTPCPRGTYNLGSSRTASDTVQSFCRGCPFGANCYGGDKIVALESHWGWRVSESLLPTEFLVLPEGYGCSDQECTDISSCGANRNSLSFMRRLRGGLQRRIFHDRLCPGCGVRGVEDGGSRCPCAGVFFVLFNLFQIRSHQGLFAGQQPAKCGREGLERLEAGAALQRVPCAHVVLSARGPAAGRAQPAQVPRRQRHHHEHFRPVWCSARCQSARFSASRPSCSAPQQAAPPPTSSSPTWRSMRCGPSS
jgi:hypothetical protein